MTNTKFKPATQTEFEAFRDAYPNRLISDVCAIGEPPLLTLNDCSDGRRWPHSIVAKKLGDDQWHIADIPLGQPLPPYERPVYPPRAEQKFKQGDKVRVNSDYAPGYASNKTGGFDKILSEYAGKTATVVGSYYDQYGGSNIEDYTLSIDGHGEVSWFPENCISKIEEAQ